MALRSLTKFVLLITISTITLFTQSGSAGPSDLLGETAIQQSFQRLNQESPNPKEILKVVQDAWNTKCANLEDQSNCYLNECDIKVPSCKSNRIVLFRGEPGKYEYSGASPLLRNVLMGLTFGSEAKSTSELHGNILDAFKLAKLNEDHLFGDGNLALVKTPSGLSWHILPYEADEMSPSEVLNNLPSAIANSGKADGAGKFFFAAQSSGYGALSFLDLTQGRKDISPLVSLSPDPNISLRFSIKPGPQSQGGRLLILSVSKNSIRKDCSKLEAPGSIVNYGGCVKKDDDDETAWERELNAVLYVPVQSILFSVGTTKDDI